jgi:predicted nucleic acid-binding protein
MKKYILDACALLSIARVEPGHEIVKLIINKANQHEVEIYMNKLNLLEVYYDLIRDKGLKIAEDYIKETLETKIRVIDDISDQVFRLAGQLKIKYNIPLGDCVLLGQAIVLDAYIVTSDHCDFDKIQSKEKIKLTWIR